MVVVKDLFVGLRFELIVRSEWNKVSIRSRHVLSTMKTLGPVD